MPVKTGGRCPALRPRPRDRELGRNNSATDQAWKGQPVAAWGASPCAVSQTDPSPRSARWASSPASGQPDSPKTGAIPRRRRVSIHGPISHGQTVPVVVDTVPFEGAPPTGGRAPGPARRDQPYAKTAR